VNVTANKALRRTNAACRAVPSLWRQQLNAGTLHPGASGSAFGGIVLLRTRFGLVKRMSNTKLGPVEEFRATVLEAYRHLLEHEGFSELPAPPGPSTNPFTTRIGNSTTVIEVEGIHYGTSAWTKIFRANCSDSDQYGLPIRALLATRAPRPAKVRRPDGQRAQILQDAADIIEYAKDVLSGDFIALDGIANQQRRLEQERIANAPSPRQRAANAACSEAGHAFNRGDYETVVDLLQPHLELLSPPQRKRYEIALKRRDA